MIDGGNYFLFGWTANQLAQDEKSLLYAHLYSFSSVKSVVHWFQIIRTKKFQMFDDTLQGGSVKNNDAYESYEIPKYQLSRIQTPIALFHGGEDSLADVNELLKNLPTPIYQQCEEEYEHLDFLWAKNVHINVHPTILRLLQEYNNTSPKDTILLNNYEFKDDHFTMFDTTDDAHK